MENAIVKLEAYDGENNNRKQDEQADLKKGRHSFYDWLQDHLQTFKNDKNCVYKWIACLFAASLAH